MSSDLQAVAATLVAVNAHLKQLLDAQYTEEDTLSGVSQMVGKIPADLLSDTQEAYEAINDITKELFQSALKDTHLKDAMVPVLLRHLEWMGTLTSGDADASYVNTLMIGLLDGSNSTETCSSMLQGWYPLDIRKEGDSGASGEGESHTPG